MLASPAMFLAQRIADVGQTDAETGRPSGAVEQLIQDAPLVSVILSALGVILFVYVIVKLVMSRMSGRGGSAAGTIGQSAVALIGAVIFMRPSTLGLAFDVMLALFNQALDWIVGLFNN